jgi:hypothetical protein
MEKRAFDFHATQLFGAKQDNNESVYLVIHNIQTFSSKFKEAALQYCQVYRSVWIVALADKLRNIYFVQRFGQIGYK